MSYMLHIVANTQKSIGLMDHLSANPNLLKNAWATNHITMTDVSAAGIDELDYNWFIHDLQKADITRMEGPKHRRHDGMAHYRVHMERMTDTTPGVLEKLAEATNQVGHPFFGAAFFLTKGRAHSIFARHPLHLMEYDGSFDGQAGESYDASM